MGTRRPLIVQMVHDPAALEPRCRLQVCDLRCLHSRTCSPGWQGVTLYWVLPAARLVAARLPAPNAGRVDASPPSQAPSPSLPAG